MIADNGDSRIIRPGQKPDKTRTHNVTVEQMEGFVEAYVTNKTAEINEFYVSQIPAVVAQMISGAFHAYDKGKRQAFDAVMKEFSPSTMEPEVFLLTKNLRAVFGVPQEQSQEPPPTTEPSEPSIEGPVQ